MHSFSKTKTAAVSAASISIVCGLAGMATAAEWQSILGA